VQGAVPGLKNDGRRGFGRPLLPSRSDDSVKKRSPSVVVHSFIDVKSWWQRTPSVAVARPSFCPRCGEAGQVTGERLGMVGHGLRARQVRGAVDHEASPAVHTLKARRYRCRRCSATVTVVPGGCVPRRHYGAGAIALACVLYGMGGATLSVTRSRVSPWRSSESGWPSIARWLRAIERGTLFARVRPWPGAWGSRRKAERVAQTVLAVARSDGSIEHRAFDGAARLACG
jgi:hypothetical protein